jgi:hypothetical protein
VTEVVIHELKPVPVNFDAPLNVSLSDVTLATLHPLRSAFISPAPALKVQYREVAEVVIHLLMSVPTNAEALELPLATYEPPASFRFSENALLKSTTPLTSQSPRAPHLVVAVAVSWT